MSVHTRITANAAFALMRHAACNGKYGGRQVLHAKISVPRSPECLLRAGMLSVCFTSHMTEKS